jgi:hypothetical protein
MPKVNREALAGGWLWFPSLTAQDAILTFIRESVTPFDTAIHQAHREISLLREYRSRLIADVVTGKLDVREAAARLPDEIDEIALTLMTPRRTIAWTIVRVLTLAAASILLLTGCDCGVRLHGVVYRWASAPNGASSRAFVDQPWAVPAQLSPVAGAEITIYNSLDEASKPGLGDWHDTSSSDGSFDVGGRAACGDHTMAVAVIMAGCRTAYGTYVNKGPLESHTAAVVLVCPDLP